MGSIPASAKDVHLTTMNVSVHYDNKRFRYATTKEATTATIKELLLRDNKCDMALEDMRLIAQGRELGDREELFSTLGEFYFHSRAMYLKRVDTSVCREWQRSGRCCAKNCALKKTHTMEHSPRYVGHDIENETPAASPAASPAPSSSPSPVSSSPSSPVPSPVPARAPQLCRNWAATGTCPFGDRCHFSHQPLQQLPPPAAAPTAAPTGTVLLSSPGGEMATSSPFQSPLPVPPPFHSGQGAGFYGQPGFQQQSPPGFQHSLGKQHELAAQYQHMAASALQQPTHGYVQPHGGFVQPELPMYQAQEAPSGSAWGQPASTAQYPQQYRDWSAAVSTPQPQAFPGLMAQA